MIPPCGTAAAEAAGTDAGASQARELRAGEAVDALPSGANRLKGRGNNGNNPTTLVIAAGMTVQGGSGLVGGYYSNDTFVNDGTITISSGQTLSSTISR